MPRLIPTPGDLWLYRLLKIYEWSRKHLDREDRFFFDALVILLILSSEPGHIIKIVQRLEYLTYKYDYLLPIMPTEQELAWITRELTNK